MAVKQADSRDLFRQLKAGERIEVVHTIIVGNKSWPSTVAGTIVRTERRRHGLHFRRAHDDKVYSDMIVLRLGDGALTTVTMDEFTELKRMA